MMKILNINKSLRIVLGMCLLILFFFLGCKKKENSCKDVVQGDFELVE